MQRRQFLSGAIGAAVLSAVGKMAPTPIVGSVPEALEHTFELRTSLPQATWRLLNQGKPFSRYVGSHHNVPIYEVDDLDA